MSCISVQYFHCWNTSDSLSRPPWWKWKTLYWLSRLATTSWPLVQASSLKKRRRERMWPRSTRNTPQICSRAHTRCGSSQRGVCRRPLLSGNRRPVSELDGGLLSLSRNTEPRLSASAALMGERQKGEEKASESESKELSLLTPSADSSKEPSSSPASGRSSRPSSVTSCGLTVDKIPEGLRAGCKAGWAPSTPKP